MSDFTSADIYALPQPKIGTATRIFEGAGRSWEITIETGGQNSAERWHELYSAVMYGQTQLQIAKIKKEKYEERIKTPEGQTLVLKDPSYIGSLKLLAEVIKKPALSFGDLANFGHRVGGRMMDQICMWAATENGVSDYMIEQMQAASKNVSGAEDSSDESDAPA